MAAIDQDTFGRNETPLERCDRNLAELLQEVRVVQTGVQVLFAFLLTVPFSAGFRHATDFQTYVLRAPPAPPPGSCCPPCGGVS